MQAYNVLLHGGKAVQYYCTVDGAIYRDGRLGPLFFPMRDLNKRMSQWGKTLMALTSEGVYHSPEVLAGYEAFDKYRESVSDSQILVDEELPFRCSVGELSDKEGNRYLFVLNRDYLNKRRFTLNFKNASRVYEVSGETGEQSVKKRCTTSMTLDLAPGDATFLRVQNADKEAFLIDYVLATGE